jgi:hypothetical protein
MDWAKPRKPQNNLYFGRYFNPGLSSSPFHSRHYLICQRYMMAHNKISSHEKECKIIHGQEYIYIYIYICIHTHTYIHTFKALPNKNEGKWKQNFTHVEKNYRRWNSACVCVCVLRILITKDKKLFFSEYNMRIHSFLQKFAAHLIPCGSTPVYCYTQAAENCHRKLLNSVQ